MRIILDKLKEVGSSILPIAALVLLLHFTLIPLSTSMLINFIIGSLLIIIGLTIFLLGVDIGIVPLGNLAGSSLGKSNKLWVVLLGGFIMGFFISIAEPSLIVLGGQVSLVTDGQISSFLILCVVSIGLAILLSFGLFRIFYKLSLRKVLIILYGIIFILSLFVSKEFLAISFDASGATTGILAVPFILSLSAGISKMNKDSNSSENDSFGLVAIASSGAIMGVMILDIIYKDKNFVSDIAIASEKTKLLSLLPVYIKEATVSLLPLVIILIFMQKYFFKLKKRDIRKILTGFAFSFIGLVIFLIAVNGSYLDMGNIIGSKLALKNNKIYILIFSFLLGLVTILAEPAVYVLVQQIDDVTSGYVPKNILLAFLSTGVGIAIFLSMLRILTREIQLWHYLLPGYIICILLMFITPKLFVAIAFDAGGVATGPITSTFILAFVQGAAQSIEGANVVVDGFGMIAMVAMMPILTIQLLGFLFELKKKRGKK